MPSLSLCSVVRYSIFGALLGSMLLGGACSPKDETSAGSTSAADVSNLERFIASYITVLCKTGLECGSIGLRYTSLEQCTEQWLISFESSPEYNNPALHYDSEKGAGCLNALESLHCDSDPAMIAALVNPCSNFVYGEADVGDACTSDSECKLGLDCLETSCPGHCIVPATQGQPCADQACAEGLGCITIRDPDTGTSESRCELDGAQGQACGAEIRECGFALACDGGVCRSAADLYPRVALGQPCTLNGQCTAGQFCGGPADIPTVCTQRIPSGAPCQTNNPSSCVTGNQCLTEAGVSICVPLIALGGNCTERQQCVAGECIAGTCQFERGNGEACSTNDECYSETCAAGVCVVGPRCTPQPASAAATP